MTHTFNIQVDNQPAVLERLLRVIRHRGFALQSMDLSAVTEHMNITFAVDSSREIHLLVNQLEKLYDVKSITMN